MRHKKRITIFTMICALYHLDHNAEKNVNIGKNAKPLQKYFYPIWVLKPVMTKLIGVFLFASDKKVKCPSHCVVGSSYSGRTVTAREWPYMDHFKINTLPELLLKYLPVIYIHMLSLIKTICSLQIYVKL